MVLEVNGEGLIRAASLADECGQGMSTVRVNGEGEGVLGSSVLAAATTAFASARTDEVARAASRAGRMADGAREALSLLTSADENAAAGARALGHSSGAPPEDRGPGGEREGRGRGLREADS